MTSLTILFLAGAAIIGPVLIMIGINRDKIGSTAVAAALGTGFALFSAVTIAREGVWTVIENHTSNLWGTQVWYDLLLSVGIALFFIAPRARQAGMNVWLWIVCVGLTASIGLLAMIARLFWLERRAV